LLRWEEGESEGAETEIRGIWRKGQEEEDNEIEEFEGGAPRFSSTLFDSMTEMGRKTLLSDEERGGGGE